MSENNKLDEEYLELRRELDKISRIAHQYRMAMYSVICLILAYLLTQNTISTPLVFLVPILIILGFYSVNIGLLFNTYYLGSYLNAFSNEFTFKWEERTNYMRINKLGKYQFKEFNENSFSKTFQYRVLVYVYLGIYFYKCIYTI